MRFAFLVSVLVACGGSSKKPESTPIDNTAKADPALAEVGHAKVVTKTGAGGVLELGSDRSKAMEDANKAMVAHCGEGNYMITQEGEEAVGDDPCATKTAWRVHYQCSN